MDFKKLSEKYFEKEIKDLQGLIQIDSTYDLTTIKDDMPYGKGVFDAMQYMKNLAEAEGFNVDMCDGHCIEISYGEGEREIGVFAHLDVVPVTGKWTYPAFGGEIHDGKVYGRGTSDDKGPAIAAFTALKLLKDNDLVKNYKVRLVLGGDEERGSSCLKYYFEELKKPHVTYGFTPDGDFPLIYGEKGMNRYNHSGKIDLSPVQKFHGGVVTNAVIDDATLVTRKKDVMIKYLKNHPEINAQIIAEKGDEITVEFFGKAAHGSLPEKGINAGYIMIKAIAECYGNIEMQRIAKMYEDPWGKTMGVYFDTDNMHNTSYNLGIVDYNNGEISILVDFRFPENVNPDEVISKISKQTGLETVKYRGVPVLYFDPNEKFIQALYETYVRETGDTVNKPMTIGGGTYAKECKNVVAFGSNFPGKEDFIHSPDEKIDLEDLTLSVAIYADAIYSLGNLK